MTDGVSATIPATAVSAAALTVSTAAKVILLLAAVWSVGACAAADPGRSTSEGDPLAQLHDGSSVQQSGERFDPGTAVLADGPYRRTGVDALGNNVIDAWRGDYTLFMESGHAGVMVEYVDRPVDLPPWDRITCERLSLLVAPPGEPTVYARSDPAGRSFFFTFAPGVDTPCRFVARFLSDFEFFRSAVEAESIPPFPAILDVL